MVLWYLGMTHEVVLARPCGAPLAGPFRDAASGRTPQHLCQQPMKVIARRFTFHAESTRIVRPALQAALHFRADFHVLALDLFADRHALGDESSPCIPFRVREVEIEHNPAALRAERQYEV